MRNYKKEITNSSIRRLARRGGCKRISSAVYTEIRNVLKEFLRQIIADASMYASYAKRSTVSPLDIVCSLKRRGITLYGYGG